MVMGVPDTRPRVTISMDEYKSLTEDAYFLGLLEDAGVSNWEGYVKCIKQLQEFQEAAST